MRLTVDCTPLRASWLMSAKAPVLVMLFDEMLHGECGGGGVQACGPHFPTGLASLQGLYMQATSTSNSAMHTQTYSRNCSD